MFFYSDKFLILNFQDDGYSFPLQIYYLKVDNNLNSYSTRRIKAD